MLDPTTRAGAPEAARAEDRLEVEAELVKERAEALGRAGGRLAGAVAAYRAAVASPDRSEDEAEALLDEVVACLYGLVVQRECAGARSGNLDAIVAAYDVPVAALRRL